LKNFKTKTIPLCLIRSHMIFKPTGKEGSRSRQNISKVLLRHSNLSTTQIYLGEVSDVEAIRWIDNLHG